MKTDSPLSSHTPQWRALWAPLIVLGLFAASCGDNNEPGTSQDVDMRAGGEEDMSNTPPADMVTAPDDMGALPGDMSSPSDMPLVMQDMSVDMQAEDMAADMSSAPDMQQDMSTSCQDECAAGEQTCDGSGGYRLCGQYDQDACLELSPTVSCTQGFSCDAGRCVQGCRDICSLGSTLCLDEQTIQVCGNFDTDACLESGADVACGSGERCEAGACVPQNQACTDECSASGETVCLGDAVRTCGQFDSDSCLDLGVPSACGVGESCSAGTCSPTCTDTCPSDGATQCSGDGVSTCSDANNDGCLEWSTPSQCGAGESCSNGACSSGACADECSSAGAPTCAPDGFGVSLCGQYDGDACLDRSSAIPCPLGFGCQNGLCVATCTDECTSGAARCGQDGTSLETCGNFDSDPCLEFGGSLACPGGASCSGNACQIACTDECTTQGVSECVAGSDATRTCGQFDLDSCLEWSTQLACESYEVCNAASCELGATPASLLINELSYDSQGRDSDPDNTLFVELWGPAGTSLEGWAVVGINGADGSETGRIELGGEVMAADGYFVIAHPQAEGALLSVADITDAKVDFQNGPDSVQLQWRGRVVDALGYGVFGAGTVFGGEGSPAAAASSGGSLTRDANHTDTDDNSADFVAIAVPTPRAAQLGCLDECPAQGNTQCVGDDVQTCGNFDADTCLEWSAQVACTTAGEVCQGGQCLPPCTNECPTQGATQCLGDQVITCGDYDADSCFEWSVPVACPSAGDSCVVNVCQSEAAPEVVLITPQGTIQTTQGNSHDILVDPTPSAGRTITRVDFYANGQLIGTTMASPHKVTYVVPTATPTNSLITLQVKATDSAGEVGVSTLAVLDVRNDAPVAAFNATVTNTTTATVDASGSTDTETATDDLEVCWDWDNDGTCETPFSTMKIQTYDFGASGMYTIGMKVRDAQGQTTSTTRQISFQDIQYLGGTDVTTTLWYGTIIVTGDLRVPAGQTLTIAPGTQVLFVNADVAPPAGVGDYTLDVQGTLIVDGVAGNPVVFSGQDITAKTPGGWDRIIVSGAGSSITHAIVEYGDVGLELKADVALEQVVVRKTLAQCILLNNADDAILTDVSVTECGTHGVHAITNSTNVMATRLSSINNGQHGVFLTGDSALDISVGTLTDNGADGARAASGSTLDMSDGVVEDNTGRGLTFLGNSDGMITRNQLRSNGAEGIGVLSDFTGVPNPVVQYNNIYSNAVTGSTTSQEASVSGISASDTSYYAFTRTSSKYTVPAGRKAKRVYVSYSESNSRCSGRLRNQSGVALRSFSSSFNGWVEVDEQVTAFDVEVSKGSGGTATCSISLTKSESIDLTGSNDVVAVTGAGTINARFNYLGAFPDVLSRVGLNRSGALDLQGYVGVLFAPATWSRGPYVGGAAESGTWSGTVYVTGDVLVEAGTMLDVAPTTQIQVIKHDQDGDGAGDWSIQADGELNLNGAQGNEVVISGYSTATGDIFQGIILGGASTSAWTDVILSGARIGISIMGASALTRVDITGASSDGLRVQGAGATLTSVSIDAAGANGAWLSGSPTVSRLDVRHSTRHGILISQGSTASVQDSTIRDNLMDGIRVENSSPSLNYNIITYNGGFGVSFYGDSAGVSEYNVVKFNDNAGLGLFSQITGAPTPTFQRSNVYGNAVTGSTTSQEASVSGISASDTSYYAFTRTSSKYTVPAGRKAKRVYVSYSESNSRCSGRLRNQSGVALRSFSSSFNGWVEVDEQVTAFDVEVSKGSGGTATCSISLTKSESTELSTDSYELVAITGSGTALAKFNYWTPSIGSVPTRIFEARSGSVDYTGFVGAEYTDAGPRATP